MEKVFTKEWVEHKSGKELYIEEHELESQILKEKTMQDLDKIKKHKKAKKKSEKIVNYADEVVDGELSKVIMQDDELAAKCGHANECVNKTKEKLIKKIQKANPELLDLTFGCEVIVDYEELGLQNEKVKIVNYADDIDSDLHTSVRYMLSGNIKEIIGHPTQLHQVLKAMGKKWLLG
jgi:hypothetical protein